MNGYLLPQEAVIGGRKYPLNTDFRCLLQIFSHLDDPELPECIRWQVAFALFFREPLPQEAWEEGAKYFVWFVNGGRAENAPPGPKLLDWERDAPMIISDVNKVAGQELRALPYVHWWTFLSFFHGIGEGQLSTVVSIRQKRLEGKKLECWEEDYYRRNRSVVDLPAQLSREEQEEKQRLMTELGLG